jgi:hypothetical protein
MCAGYILCGVRLQVLRKASGVESRAAGACTVLVYTFCSLSNTVSIDTAGRCGLYSDALAVEVLLIAGVEVLAGGCLECQAFSHCEVISNFMRASFNEC